MKDDKQQLPTSWLKPWEFNEHLQTPHHIIPGPMEGVMQGSFVTVMSKLGLVDSWLVPFIRISTGVPSLKNLQRRLAPFLDSGLPVMVQLLGTNIPLLCQTAKRLQKLPITSIDLNCGCPSSTVIRNGGGGALLRTPQWIYEAACELRKACSNCGLTIKVRSGFSNPNEMKILLPLLESANLDAVIVHFRTVEEQYQVINNGNERLRMARELLPTTTLIGSGDLFSVEDAWQMYDVAKVDGIAPARGLLRNPWLIQQIIEIIKGETTTKTTNQNKISFLTTMTNESNPTAPSGFIIQLAKQLLGQNTQIFQKLIKCKTIADTKIMFSNQQNQ